MVVGEGASVRPLRGEDPDRIADYRLLGRLGAGGMGVVYLARSPRGRMVAVKTIRAELAAAPDFRRRFARETAVAQRVGGRWTAAVLAADPDGELPWVATAYIPGPTLHQVVAERHGPLPEHSVRGLASGLCQALGDIHAAGLIHRDLKPSNVMVTIDGPRLIDFGIVRALDASTTGGLTTTGVVIGSPGFMSPEQIRGERLTEASDVFSLGAVLAFAATGRLPFGAPEGQLHALMYRVVHDPPDLTDVPGPLLGLIRDCLTKDPADRPTLAALRERDETRARPLGPWLPPELLARLGQDAAQLLDQEDPHTRTGPASGAVPSTGPAAGAPAAAPTEPARPPTAPLTTPSAHASQAVPSAGGDSPYQRTAELDEAGRSETSRRRLVDERRSPGGTSRRALYWLLAFYALLAALTVVHQLFAAAGQGESQSVDTRSDLRVRETDEIANALLAAQVLVGVGLVVCWLIWFFQIRSAAERFAPGRLRYRPRMAVIGWFIPVGNLFLPKQVANDVWHAYSSPGRGGGMAPAGLLHLWWSLWLATFLTWPFFWTPWTETVVWDQDATERFCDECHYDYWYWYEFEPLTWFSLALHALVVPTVIVTGLCIRRLTAMQTARPNG
ncbi:protein kinase [Streptomyces sp. NPDC127098]|uniref:protein kinase domain-containing protein n=1 Tax=Streptomyces sp. NPDC127098 TaxID=3347137 RepID=UPI0036477455